MRPEVQQSRDTVITHECAGSGEPTAASWDLYSPEGVLLCSSAAPGEGARDPALDPVSTAIASAAAAGDTALTLDDSTGVVVGRSYVLQDPDTLVSEVVRVKGIDAETDEITLFDPLLNAYPDESAVYGRVLTAEIDADYLGTLGEGYEVRWTITQGDDPEYETSTYFDVALSAWPVPLLSGAEFRAYAGALGSRTLSRREQEPEDFSDAIARATDEVRSDLRDRQMLPGRFRDPTAFKVAVAERVLLDWADAGTNTPSTYQNDPRGWLVTRREVYGTVLNQACNTARYDADESGVVDASEASRRWGSVSWAL